MNVTLDKALLSLYPKAKWTITGSVYSGLDWQDDLISKPSEEELNAEVERLKVQYVLDSCKEKAKQLIANCDWSVLPDVNISNRSEFEAYRATLRGLIINPVADPDFPVEPQPVWV